MSSNSPFKTQAPKAEKILQPVVRFASGSPSSIKQLIEAGFDYVTSVNGLAYFRKRK